MKKEYNDPKDPSISDEFIKNGKVVFFIPKRKALMLKRLTITFMKLDESKKRSSNIFNVLYLKMAFILRMTILSLYSYGTIKIFDFYLINRYKIRNIHQELIDNKNIELTYSIKPRVE